MADPKKEDTENGSSDSKIVHRGAKVIPLIIGNETFEKLGTIGSSANLLVYFVTVFNLKSSTATNLVNILNGSTNLATLPAAFLTDTYFGRYNVLAMASIASFLGMLVLTLTAATPALHPQHCISISCQGPSPWQLIFLLGGLILLIIGGGGIRPCNLAFGIDQFDPKDESSKAGIVSFFNWYYLGFTIAIMVAATVIVYVQSNVSWGLGLGIPTGLMFLSCLLFFSGSKMYVRVKPVGSPFVSVVQVIVSALKKRHLILSDESNLLVLDTVDEKSSYSRLPHTNQFRFLEKAAMITEEDELNIGGTAVKPWELCSIEQVEQVKCLMRIIPIWVSGTIYYVFLVTLMQNNVVFQAQQSNRHVRGTTFQIPSGSFFAFSMLAITFFVPLYDRLIVPAISKITKRESGITPLQRIGFGMIVSIPTLLLAGIVEKKRRTMALASGSFTSPMSWVWLVPQMVLGGLSDAFAIIGLFEFYYNEVPDNMKSLGGSFYCCGMAMASYLTSFIVTMVHKATTGSRTGNWLPDDLNKGRLDYYYYFIAAMELVNLVYFLACAKSYKYKGSWDGMDNKGDDRKAEIIMI
ncbi:hypothetical protein Droror1_Dr00021175 [Drosera rotundifolia]